MDSANPGSHLGRVIDGRYRLEGPLGEGAHGTVYRAWHLGLGRAVAVKLLAPGQADGSPAHERFRQEARALGRLQHAHVVGVSDFGVDRETGEPYLVMELLSGRSLADVLGERGAIPAQEALPLLASIAAALDAAHTQGILHRDLKPANVWVEAGSGRVKVLDFGLAKLVEQLAAGASETLTSAEPATSGTVGTPLYGAPELFRGEPASRAADLYSFAILAYEVLVGAPPFRGNLGVVIDQHLTAELPSGGLAGEVITVLRRGAAKDPTQRSPSAGALVEELARAIAAPAVAAWQRRRRWGRRLTTTGLAGGLVAFVAFPAPTALPALERWLRDHMTATLPAAAPPGNLLLVNLDEATVPGRRSLAERADEIAAGCEALFAAGAGRLAFDLLLPPRWADSAPFARLLVAHPDKITLAAFSTPDGRVVGPEAIPPLAEAALQGDPDRGGAASLFGFVNVDEDPDGLVRRGRLAFRDTSGALRRSWAAHVVHPPWSERRLAEGSGHGFWIDPRLQIDPETISWSEAMRWLEHEPERVQRRWVMIGAAVSAEGDDVHRVRGRHGRVEAIAGLMLQARLVGTITRGLPFNDAPTRQARLAAALLAALGAAVAARASRLPGVCVVLGLLSLVWFTLTWVALTGFSLFVPMVNPLLALGVAVFASWVPARWLALKPPTFSPVVST